MWSKEYQFLHQGKFVCNKGTKALDQGAWTIFFTESQNHSILHRKSVRAEKRSVSKTAQHP